ncbi:hypothetical protein Tco_0005754 [Tanacetum coccineum]
MSTAEAKYVSLSACCAQVIWMRTQLLNYRYKYNRIPMYCDSKVTIAIHATQVQHSKYKNITSVPFIKNIEKCNGIYDIVDRVMRPLALIQTRRPRSDRDKARYSVSSSSSHHHGTSFHQHDDDDDNVETSRASTPSPTTYLNSLNPLNY